MTRHVEFIDGGALVSEAAELMGELDVGALPVGTPDRLDGVVTDRDILYRVVAKGLDPATIRVGEIASHPVVGCGAEDSVQATMDVMAAHHIRRLAVRDDEGRVVGWITLADLARHLLVEDVAIQGTLRKLTRTPD